MFTKKSFAIAFLSATAIIPLLTGLRAAAERDQVDRRVTARQATLQSRQQSRGETSLNAQRPTRGIAHRGPGDLVQHDISTQDECEEVTSPSQRDHRWHQGLSLNVDNEILGGEIVAYQIQWFGGTWSKWFVPGVNDIDLKVNQGQADTMRRRWSYFYDHTHRYLIVRPKSVRNAKENHAKINLHEQEKSRPAG